MSYISKNFYTPKNMESKNIHNYSSTLANSSNSTNYNQTNYSITHSQMCQSPNNSSKIGNSYTASSTYAVIKKPALFKSSKYIISKTETGK